MSFKELAELLRQTDTILQPTGQTGTNECDVNTALVEAYREYSIIYCANKAEFDHEIWSLVKDAPRGDLDGLFRTFVVRKDTAKRKNTVEAEAVALTSSGRHTYLPGNSPVIYRSSGSLTLGRSDAIRDDKQVEVWDHKLHTLHTYPLVRITPATLQAEDRVAITSAHIDPQTRKLTLGLQKPKAFNVSDKVVLRGIGHGFDCSQTVESLHLLPGRKRAGIVVAVGSSQPLPSLADLQLQPDAFAFAEFKPIKSCCHIQVYADGAIPPLPAPAADFTQRFQARLAYVRQLPHPQPLAAMIDADPLDDGHDPSYEPYVASLLPEHQAGPAHEASAHPSSTLFSVASGTSGTATAGASLEAGGCAALTQQYLASMDASFAHSAAAGGSTEHQQELGVEWAAIRPLLDRFARNASQMRSEPAEGEAPLFRGGSMAQSVWLAHVKLDSNAPVSSSSSSCSNSGDETPPAISGCVSSSLKSGNKEYSFSSTDPFSMSMHSKSKTIISSTSKAQHKRSSEASRAADCAGSTAPRKLGNSKRAWHAQKDHAEQPGFGNAGHNKRLDLSQRMQPAAKKAVCAERSSSGGRGSERRDHVADLQAPSPGQEITQHHQSEHAHHSVRQHLGQLAPTPAEVKLAAKLLSESAGSVHVLHDAKHAAASVDNSSLHMPHRRSCDAAPANSPPAARNQPQQLVVPNHAFQGIHLDQMQQDILQYLRNHPQPQGLTARALRAALGADSKTAINRAVYPLVAAGLVQKLQVAGSAAPTFVIARQ